MIDVRNNCKYQILTPTGFQDFIGIKKSSKETIKIRFTDGSVFICTPDHILIEDSLPVVAASLRPGSIINSKRVVSVTLNGIEDVYDPIDVSDGSLYYSDGLVSHNCQFLGSSKTLIRADIIAQMSVGRLVYTDAEGLDLYQEPIKDHSYVIVVDTAKGVGGDYSAFSIINITDSTYIQVGKYRNNTISPLLYPHIIYKMAKQYNGAYVLIEINSSEQVPYILYHELEYEYILFVSRANGSQYVSGGFGGGNIVLGVTTDKKVKRTGCHNLKALLEEQKLIVQDTETIAELSTFIETNGSYAADEGYHDDLVMTLVLFAWLTSNAYFKDLNNRNIREMLYKKQMQAIEDEVIMFRHFDGGEIDDEKPPLDF